MVASNNLRHRYVVFRVTSDSQISEKAMADAIGKALNQHSRALVHYDGSSGIVRCTNLNKDRTIATLKGIRSVGGREVKIETYGTSGTIRKAKMKFIH